MRGDRCSRVTAVGELVSSPAHGHHDRILSGEPRYDQLYRFRTLRFPGNSAVRSHIAFLRFSNTVWSTETASTLDSGATNAATTVPTAMLRRVRVAPLACPIDHRPRREVKSRSAAHD